MKRSNYCLHTFSFSYLRMSSFILSFSGVRNWTSSAGVETANTRTLSVAPQGMERLIDTPVFRTLLPARIIIWLPLMRRRHWTKSVTFTKSSRRSKTSCISDSNWFLHPNPNLHACFLGFFLKFVCERSLIITDLNIMINTKHNPWTM